jgi:hypothetical protein
VKPTDFRRAVLAAEIPFRLELRGSCWPIICDGPNWSISPHGDFFTHVGADGTITIRASAVAAVISCATGTAYGGDQ